MQAKISRFARRVPGETMLPRQLPRSAASVALTLAALLALAATARAQESTPDGRRCTGQWRATNDERIASCAALIDSGRFQPANLAILHHDRGVAM